MWWIEFENTMFWVPDPHRHSTWSPASPVGEDARRIALLQCVPIGRRVPGVGRRLIRLTVMRGVAIAFELEDT